jgi:molybdenum cofactor biosynthesis enzyme
VDRGMVIQDLVLVEKSGGVSGDYHRPAVLDFAQENR